MSRHAHIHCLPEQLREESRTFKVQRYQRHLRIVESQRLRSSLHDDRNRVFRRLQYLVIYRRCLPRRFHPQLWALRCQLNRLHRWTDCSALHSQPPGPRSDQDPAG
jgi:hypothetical protein